jgi:transcriptional regulator with XRE-family HTH domain
MANTSSSLGDLLRRARLGRGLTQRGVEQATGISNPYLSQLESGKIRKPSPSVLHRLCALYSVSYTDAMELAGHPVPADDVEAPVHRSLAARIGPVTADEEAALAEYLAFLRSRRQKGGRR